MGFISTSMTLGALALLATACAIRAGYVQMQNERAAAITTGCQRFEY
jgi:hypothetical protein